MANGNQREKIKAGTTSFLPPEVASGEEYSSNQKLDIWAMGVILYLMVEGCYPFTGKNAKEIVKSILKDNLEFNKKLCKKRKRSQKRKCKKKTNGPFRLWIPNPF